MDLDFLVALSSYIIETLRLPFHPPAIDSGQHQNSECIKVAQGESGSPIFLRLSSSSKVWGMVL